jgi:hypothetical protein
MDFPKYKMVDGKRYGPTEKGRYYQPIKYHNPIEEKNKKGKKAKRKEHEDKTHWVLKMPEQYHVFLAGDKNELIDENGMYSVLDNCRVVFGENGQRIAFFWIPKDNNWHGFPIFSWEKRISEKIANKMLKAGLINDSVRIRILDELI